MRPQDFKRWRKALSFSQKEAAEALGLKRRVVQYYEKGERGGAKVKVPKTVRLACAALSQGVSDYQGPEKPVAGKKTTDAKKAPGKGSGAKKAPAKKLVKKAGAKKDLSKSKGKTAAPKKPAAKRKAA